MNARRTLGAGVAAGLVFFATTLAAPLGAAESGPAWRALTPAQQQALAPLAADWSSLDAARKQKWLELAGRLRTMPPEERERIRERMAQWSRLTPSERASARLQFEEARQLSPRSERQAQWQAYQALPPEERAALAQRARSASGSSAAGSEGKRNLVAPAAAPQTRAVAPTVKQLKPGATTTTMGTPAAPPPHHQAGLPKIAATPGFVDPATLLPQRGPQGAAMRSASAPSGADKPQ